MNKKLKKLSTRRSEMWTREGTDIEIEFREPSGAFVMEMTRQREKKSSNIDGVSAGCLLIAEVVYIDGEKAFEDAAEAEAYLNEAGAAVLNEMLRRSGNIVGMTKKDIEEAEKN